MGIICSEWVQISTGLKALELAKPEEGAPGMPPEELSHRRGVVGDLSSRITEDLSGPSTRMKKRIKFFCLGSWETDAHCEQYHE